MAMGERHINWAMLARLVRKAWLAGVFVLFSATVVSVSGSHAQTGCNINAQSLSYVQNAIATQPSIANNPEALAAYMAIVGQESAYNTQAVGRYVDSSGNLVDASYGLGQVNYYSHQAAINALVLADTGSDISALPYNERKAIGGQWLLDNPQAATNLSAEIFSDLLSRSGGDIARAVYNYNGGGDPNYLSHVQSWVDRLEACGITANTALVLSTTSTSAPPTASAPLDCPDLELAEALEAANEAYGAAMLQVVHEAQTQTMEQFSQSRQSGFLWNVGSKYCLVGFEDWYNAIRSLISGFDVWGMLITAVESILSSLLSRVCGMIVSYVNNLLTNICIPLPDFNLSGALRLGNFGGSEFCNGISAADAIGLRQRVMPSRIRPLPTATEIFDNSPLARQIQNFSIIPEE